MLLLLQNLLNLAALGARWPRSRTPALNANKLDRLVVIESATLTRDDTGEPIPTWEELAQVWAEWVDTAGNERFADRRTEAHTGPLIRIRWRTHIDEKMRIVDGVGGPVYGIDHIAEIGRNVGLEIRLSGPL
jgi:SPP1 family predicted phage head-tail adaptor